MTLAAFHPVIGLLWAPAAPTALIAATAGAVALLALVATARTWRGRPALSAALLAGRLAVVASLATLLLGPSRVPPLPPESHKQPLTILVDTSASMATCDDGIEPRFTHAARVWLNPANLARLSAAFEVDLRGFDQDVRPLSPDALRQPATQIATGRQTRLAEALMTVLEDAHASQILLLTDGHDNSPPGDESLNNATNLARQRGIPIHTLCLGSPVAPPDIALASAELEQPLIAGQTGHLLARVTQTGFDHASTVLHLRGSSGEAAAAPIHFDGRASVSVDLPIHPAAVGEVRYDLSVDPLPGEVSTANNRRIALGEVVGAPIRVLLLEGEPSWDTRNLTRALADDDRLFLTQITRLASGQTSILTIGGTPDEGAMPGRMPEAADDWTGYDVVVLGRGVASWLASMPGGQALVDGLRPYVERGGHVWFARGSDGQDFAPLEPVVWATGAAPLAGDEVRATPAGERLPPLAAAASTLGQDSHFPTFQGIQGVRPVARVKPAATVVLEAAPGGAMPGGHGEPVLISMPFGRGSILMLNGQDWWHWAMPPTDDAGRLYPAFVTGLVRWLALAGDFVPARKVMLRVWPRTVLPDEPVSLRIDARHDLGQNFQPRVTITDPRGGTHEFSLAPTHNDPETRIFSWFARFTAKEPGLYRARLDAPPLAPASSTHDQIFQVDDADPERLDPSANPAALRRLAEETGGLALTDADAPRLVDLLARRASETAGARAGAPVPAWDRADVLVALLGWLSVEWIIRRRVGWK